MIPETIFYKTKEKLDCYLNKAEVIFRNTFLVGLSWKLGKCGQSGNT
jgi:hypothetical protein